MTLKKLFETYEFNASDLVYSGRSPSEMDGFERTVKSYDEWKALPSCSIKSLIQSAPFWMEAGHGASMGCTYVEAVKKVAISLHRESK